MDFLSTLQDYGFCGECRKRYKLEVWADEFCVSQLTCSLVLVRMQLRMRVLFVLLVLVSWIT